MTQKCEICGREVESVIDVSTKADDPDEEDIKHDLCLRCYSIIIALNGQDKFRTVMDMFLGLLAVLNQMLAKDLEYGPDEEPRKSVVEMIEQWKHLASVQPWPPYDPTSR